MPLESGPSEQPSCPNCSTPLRESTSDAEDYKFAAIDAGIFPSATVRCLECGERVKVTVKRLYHTEVVRWLPPLSAWVRGEPPICPRCGACAVTQAGNYIDFDCGTSWCELEGINRSEKCKRDEKADE